MDAVLSVVLTAGGVGVELACDGADEGPRERSRFLIARRDAENAEVLVLGLPDGQTALPVFGLEEEAGMFMRLETAGEGWRVLEISEADLAALLRESCAGVRRVVYPFAAEVPGKGPASVDREDFLRALSGERSRRGEGAGRKTPPRVSAGKGRDFW
jgi:hypothetical protein